jgi:hypothetical protein
MAEIYGSHMQRLHESSTRILGMLDQCLEQCLRIGDPDLLAGYLPIFDRLTEIYITESNNQVLQHRAMIDQGGLK